MTSVKEIYLGLGGNIGDTATILRSAIHEIQKIPEVFDVIVSRFYLTSPIGGPPQNHFINCVCQLKTTLSPAELFKHLTQIEMKLGKLPKPKNDPRIIDIDFLFYGNESYYDQDLEIPHPRWKERLFVLIPLTDFVSNILNFDLQQLIDSCPNKEGQLVLLTNQRYQ